VLGRSEKRVGKLKWIVHSFIHRWKGFLYHVFLLIYRRKDLLYAYAYHFLFVGLVQNGECENKPVVDPSGVCAAVADIRSFLCANHYCSERGSKRSWLGIFAVSFHIFNHVLNLMLIIFNDIWDIEIQHIMQFVWMGVHQLIILIGDLDQGLTIGWLHLRYATLYKFPSIINLINQIWFIVLPHLFGQII